MTHTPLHGWRGRVLHVDLATGRHQILEPAREDYLRFIGGKGLAGRLLTPHAANDWNAPDTPLLFMVGPLTATIAPTSGRATVMSLSPLTNILADASVGGRLGTELKRAGLDGLMLTGCAAAPVGLHISGDGQSLDVTLEDASRFTGRPTGEIFASLQGAGSICCTGPAAEHGVRFAALCVDKHHAAGRAGLGLVAASKNLKYLVLRGTGRVPVADLQSLKQAREAIMRLTAASSVLMGQNGFTCFGTGALFDLMHSRRMMPTHNFRQTRFDAAPQLNAVAFRKRFQPRRHGCKGCHILCKKIARGDHEGMALPEFETMSHFSALIGNVDLELVARANELCNALGMDTISAAATLACHAELENAPLPPDRVPELLEDMALGRGLGAELAQGSLAYATSKGHPELSMSVKGLELPAYDPRGAYGMALAYSVSTRGGCHLRAYPISHEILRKPVSTDRFSFSGKARIIKLTEDMNAVVDSLSACKFVFFAASLEEYAKAYTAVTGEDSSTHGLLRAGERIDYQERLINACRGSDHLRDDLPPRFFSEPGTGGDGLEIPPLDRREFLEARARYYRIRGLDAQGRPLREKALSLELGWPACLETTAEQAGS